LRSWRPTDHDQAQGPPVTSTRTQEVLGRVWPDGHSSSQISSEAITTMAR
jgi:hypothetical protein